MKKYFLTIISSLMLLASCSVNNNNDLPDLQTIITHWHLIRTTGGVASVNDLFPLETVVWTFNEQTFEITVENNNADDTKQDALDSGTYTYSVIEVNDDTFLNINGTEFGGFTITTDQLRIDQNDLSTGSGADGFVYIFERTLEVVE